MVNFKWKNLLFSLFGILFVGFIVFFIIGMLKTMALTPEVVFFIVCVALFAIVIPAYFSIRIFKEERRNKNV